MISSSLSGDRWVLSLWVPLHTVTFLSAHQSLVSSFSSPTPRLLPFAVPRPPPAGYRCAEFSLKEPLKSCWLQTKQTLIASLQKLHPSLSLLGRNNKVTSLTLVSNSLSSLVPSPPRPALRRPPHPFLNPPRDRPCNPIKSTLGPNE